MQDYATAFALLGLFRRCEELHALDLADSDDEAFTGP
jgi:hypothetical protein